LQSYPRQAASLAAQLMRCLRCMLPLLFLVVAPVQLNAQAGSRPALLIDSISSFHGAISGSVSGAGGSDQLEALVPQGALRLPQTARFLLWVELSSGQLNVL
jgi:hypothetical protein